MFPHLSEWRRLYLHAKICPRCETASQVLAQRQRLPMLDQPGLVHSLPCGDEGLVRTARWGPAVPQPPRRIAQGGQVSEHTDQPSPDSRVSQSRRFSPGPLWTSGSLFPKRGHIFQALKSMWLQSPCPLRSSPELYIGSDEHPEGCDRNAKSGPLHCAHPSAPGLCLHGGFASASHVSRPPRF